VRYAKKPRHILIYIQQDATLHSLFYLETDLHASGVTTTHHQERKQLYLQHLLFVTPLLLPAAIVEELELVKPVPDPLRYFSIYYPCSYMISQLGGIALNVLAFLLILTCC
jgi:hypothetical protein